MNWILNLTVLVSLLPVTFATEAQEPLHWSHSLTEHGKIVLLQSPRVGDDIKNFVRDQNRETISKSKLIYVSVEVRLSVDEVERLANGSPLEILATQFSHIYYRTGFMLIPAKVVSFDAAQRNLKFEAVSNLDSVTRLSLLPAVEMINYASEDPKVLPQLISSWAKTIDDQFFYPDRVSLYVRTFLGANQAQEFEFEARDTDTDEGVRIRVIRSRNTDGSLGAFQLKVLNSQNHVILQADMWDSRDHGRYELGQWRQNFADSFTEYLSSANQGGADRKRQVKDFELERVDHCGEVLFKLTMTTKRRSHEFQFSADDLQQQTPVRFLGR